MARVDYDKQSAVYDRGRELPPEALVTWMAAARRHIGEGVERILDLGSGTGRFSTALADAFDAEVVAVEPSAGMRLRAAPKTTSRVRVVGGTAEQIPVRDDSCAAAWLSNVIHHFDDVEAAARELRRVVVPGGPVLVRGAFGGRPVPSLYHYFPGTERTVESFPRIPEILDTFERSGFSSAVSIEKVEQMLARSLAELVERMKLRADTTLELLTDEEFSDGIARMEEAARTETGPVVDELDLLVVR